MGYGLPAAIAAKMRYPDREVICLAGDGCLQMTIQEMGTAAQEGANVIVIVSDNGMYGTIRMHQEREYPGRVSGTWLQNPSFAPLAEAYGFHGEIVTDDLEFPAAFERSRSAGRPALIHVVTSSSAIAPGKSLPK